MHVFLSCSWLAVVAWLLLRAFSQRNLLQRPPATAPPAVGKAPRIAVIVPARDEQANIVPCLASLTAQNYPVSRLHIIVVDDHSEDATVALVTSFAGDHSNISLLSSPPLPPGWIGKCHACAIGAAAAPAETEWLCFLDADVQAVPHALASALATAGRQDLDLLSLAPRQRLASFAERLMIPCGLYIIAFCQDLRAEQSPDSDRVTATGQFMLVRRAAYEMVGGHAAIASEICEDIALARLIKRSGCHVVLADGHELISTRMYAGWRSLWLGLVKNLVDMLGGPVMAIVTALAAFILSWAAVLIPVVDGLGCAHGLPGACISLAPALLATAAAIGLHIAGAFYFDVPPWYGLLFPLACTLGAAMVIDSLRRRAHGRVPWKGRTYP